MGNNKSTILVQYQGTELVGWQTAASAGDALGSVGAAAQTAQQPEHTEAYSSTYPLFLRSDRSLHDDLPPRYNVDSEEIDVIALRCLMRSAAQKCRLAVKSRLVELGSRDEVYFKRVSHAPFDWSSLYIHTCVKLHTDRDFFEQFADELGYHHNSTNVLSALLDDMEELVEHDPDTLRTFSNFDERAILAGSEARPMLRHIANSLYVLQRPEKRVAIDTKTSFSSPVVNASYVRFEDMMKRANSAGHPVMVRSDDDASIDDKMENLKRHDCNAFVLGGPPRALGEHNEANAGAIREEFALCASAHLCHDRIMRCMQKDRMTFAQCAVQPHAMECYRVGRRAHEKYENAW